MTEQHPLRCGTCAPKCQDFRELQQQDRILASRSLAEWKRFTALKGCASHSSAKSCGKVLDEILQELSEDLQAYFDPEYPLYLSPGTPGGQAIRTALGKIRSRAEREQHTKPISENRENLVFKPVRHVDGD